MIEKLTNSCIWLIGKSPDIDVLWSYNDFEVKNDIEDIETGSLFEVRRYKYILKKQNFTFLKHSNRANWGSQVLIKGIEKEDKDLMNPEDALIFVDEVKRPILVRNFVEDQKMDFDEQEMKFLTQLSSLHEVLVCQILKIGKIEQEKWEDFLPSAPKFVRRKIDLEFFEEGIANDSIIPSIYYALRAMPSCQAKSILEFIHFKIQSGAQIWELNQFWKDFLNKIS